MTVTGTVNALQWAVPAGKTRPTVGLDELLKGLSLLSDEDERRDAAHRGWSEDTPPSVQAIKSGALGITRWWSKGIGIAGGVTGLATLVTGYVTAFTRDLELPVVVALIGGSALVLAASAIAIALFVAGDLRARGEATAARYTARGTVTAAFLTATAQLTDQAGAPAPQTLVESLLTMVNGAEGSRAPAVPTARPAPGQR